jgi:ribosomal protein S18 acetylase RimI-like enzyme
MSQKAPENDTKQEYKLVTLRKADAKSPKSLAYISALQKIEKHVFPSSEAMDLRSTIMSSSSLCYIILHVSSDGPVAYAVTARLGRVTMLYKLCVSDQYRRKGLAKQLLRRVISDEEGRGARSIELFVDEERSSARKLYLDIGFIEAAEAVKDYYGPGRDAKKAVMNLVDSD